MKMTIPTPETTQLAFAAKAPSYIAYWDKYMVMYTAQENRAARVYLTSQRPILKAELNAAGTRLFILFNNNAVSLYDTTTWKYLQYWVANEAAFTPGGEQLLLIWDGGETAAQDPTQPTRFIKTVRVDSETGNVLSAAEPKVHTSLPTPYFSPTNTTWISSTNWILVDDAGNASLFGREGQLLTTRVGIKAVSFNGDGDKVALQMADGVEVVLLKNGFAFSEGFIADDKLTRIELNAFGNRLLTQNRDSCTLKLWQTAFPDTPLLTLKGNESEVCKEDRLFPMAHFDLLGERVALAGEYLTFCPSGVTERNEASDVAMWPNCPPPRDNCHLAKSNDLTEDTSVFLERACEPRLYLFNAMNGNLLNTYPHQAAITNYAFQDNGKRLFSSGNDGLVYLIDAGNGDELAKLYHDHAVLWSEFRPNAEQLLTFDGTLRLWQTDVSALESMACERLASRTMQEIDTIGDLDADWPYPRDVCVTAETSTVTQ
jgi:WD40 repeat protein